MIYGEGRGDMAAFLKAQPIEKGFKPGSLWRYSSGDSILAAFLLQEIYKGQDIRKIFKEKIFDPLEMKDWTWESDSAGTFSGPYYFYCSARDLAQIGQLLLGRGQYKKHEIFNSAFWKFMTTVPEAFKTARVDLKGNSVSGAHIWLNLPHVGGVPQSWPTVPSDAIAARGHWGQYLVVVPSLKAVIVRLGDTRDDSVSLDGLLPRVMPLLNGYKAKMPAKEEVTSMPAPPAVQDWDLTFSSNLMQLGAGFTAKSFCSCLFVTKNDESSCRNYASLKQVNPRLTVDFAAKKTKSSFFFLFGRQAEYLGPERGCVLR